MNMLRTVHMNCQSMRIAIMLIIGSFSLRPCARDSMQPADNITKHHVYVVMQLLSLAQVNYLFGATDLPGGAHGIAKYYRDPNDIFTGSYEARDQLTPTVRRPASKLG